MQSNVENITKETRSKVTEALGALYDAQLALQKSALETARATLESGLDLQRSGLAAVTRAVDAALRPQPVDAEAFRGSIHGFVATLPGITPEVADQLAKDVTAVFAELQTTTVRTSDAVREAAVRGAQQYESFLADVATRAKPGFEAAGENAASATSLANRVAGAWVGAFFDAVQSAVAATATTGKAVAESADAGLPPTSGSSAPTSPAAPPSGPA